MKSFGGETHGPEAIMGRYANYFEIGHTAQEFVFCFCQCCCAEQEPLLHTKIIMNPKDARQLLDILQGALKQHERDYGPVS
jgi:hypothetical protein